MRQGALTMTLMSIRKSASGGAVVQLGAHLNGIQEVTGSTPVGSTKKSTTYKNHF